jgi:hypothetical protein
MIARATNPARYPLTVRRIPALAGLLTCVAIGAPAVSATGAAEHSCAGTRCEVAGAAAAAPAITAAGVGGVRIGRTYRSLRAAGLLGKVVPGCELGGPRTRSAPLRAPLAGSVDLTFGSPRRVAAITVRGGARARGVGIGASIARIRAAFPRAVVDHAGEDVFGLTFVRVPRSGGGRIEFAVDVRTRKVTLIGIPRIPLCE